MRSLFRHIIKVALVVVRRWCVCVCILGTARGRITKIIREGNKSKRQASDGERSLARILSK